MPTTGTYSDKAKFVQAKMTEKHPLPKWNCQVVRRDQGFLSSYDETSQYLVVSYNGDRVDIFVIKSEINTANDLGAKINTNNPDFTTQLAKEEKNTKEAAL